MTINRDSIKAPGSPLAAGKPSSRPRGWPRNGYRVWSRSCRHRASAGHMPVASIPAWPDCGTPSGPAFPGRQDAGRRDGRASGRDGGHGPDGAGGAGADRPRGEPARVDGCAVRGPGTAGRRRQPGRRGPRIAPGRRGSQAEHLTFAQTLDAAIEKAMDRYRDFHMPDSDSSNESWLRHLRRHPDVADRALDALPPALRAKAGRCCRPSSGTWATAMPRHSPSCCWPARSRQAWPASRRMMRVPPATTLTSNRPCVPLWLCL